MQNIKVITRVFTIWVVVSLGLSAVKMAAQPTNAFTAEPQTPSADAVSMGRMIETPVNNFSGTPSISIPIHQITTGPLSCNIAISYQAIGVRAGDPSSCVGMGWSLSAGGMISRTVSGTPDESDGLNGILKHTGLLRAGEVVDGRMDSEPDVFSFSFNGKSGKFIIDRSIDKIIQFPHSDLKIIPSDDDLDEFLILDTDGTRYTFGNKKNDDYYGFVNYPGQQGVIFKSYRRERSEWYLRMVESTDRNHVINFEYEDHIYALENLGTAEIGDARVIPGEQGDCTSGGLFNVRVCVNQTATVDFDTNGPVAYLPVGSTRAPQGLWVSIMFFQSKVISRITYNDDTDQVIFNHTRGREDLTSGDLGYDQNAMADEAKYLSGVRVEEGGFCKKFSLSHDYFRAYDSSNAPAPELQFPLDNRLKLNSIREIACDNSTNKPAYSFTYKRPEGLTYDWLPWRLSKATDLWGFYNGADGNDALRKNIPESTLLLEFPGGSMNQFTFGDANRSVDSLSSLYGVLETIRHPHGARTVFSYETNDYSLTETEMTFLPWRENGGLVIFSERMSCIEDSTDPLEMCCRTTVDGFEVISEAFHELKITQEMFDEGCFLVTSDSTCIEGDVQDEPFTGIYKIEILDSTGNFSYGEVEMTHNDVKSIMPYNIEDNFFKNDTLVPDVKYLIRLWGFGTKVTASLRREVEVEIIENRKIGGLRVKEIETQHRNGDTALKSTFSYREKNKPNKSSGRLLIEPQPAFIFLNDSTVSTENGPVLLVRRFSSSPILPSVDINGTYYGYSDVQVTELNGAENRSQYRMVDIPIEAIVASYPIPPIPYFTETGQMIASEQRTPFKVVQRQELIGDERKLGQSANYYRFKRYSTRLGTQFFAITKYNREGQYYLNDTIRTTIDGVTTTTTMAYDPMVRHLMPIEESMTNSNGKEYKTVTQYGPEYQPELEMSAVRNDLIERNMIAPPVKTMKFVNDVQVDGTELFYGYFDAAGDFEITFAPTSIPYPYVHNRYEATFDQAGEIKDASWHLIGVFPSYDIDVGYPNKYLHDQWPDPIEYTWSSTGRMLERSYLGHVKSYNYYDQSSMIRRVTNIDETSQEFRYDQLFRLSQIKDICRGVVSDFDYIYGSTSNGNYVGSTVNYPILGDKVNTDIRTRMFYDDLGRHVQTLSLNQAPDGSSHIAITTQYDSVSRPFMQYEPQAVPSVSDDFFDNIDFDEFTLTEYEESPLNRVRAVTQPQWPQATRTSYRSNEEDDQVFDHLRDMDYDPSVLNVTEITDQNANITRTFVDKVGRTILARSINGDDSNEFIDTYQLYDDKDRNVTIIPPGSDLDETDLNYYYTYFPDDLIETKDLPDKGLERYSYNDRDLMSYYQDANMRALGRSYVTQFDQYGRQILEGFSPGDPVAHNSFVQADILSDTLMINEYFDISEQHKDKLKQSNTKILIDTPFIRKNYVYDACGRALTTTGNNIVTPEDFESYSMTYVYDSRDNVVKSVDKIPNGAESLLVTNRMKYDHIGRLKEESIQIGSYSPITLSHIDYTPKEQIKKVFLGGRTHTLESCEYSYLANRYMSGINNVDDIATNDNLFALKLNYESQNSKLGAPEVRLNGDIIAQEWTTRSEANRVMAYEYDYLNRLTTSTYSDQNRYNSSYTYDGRGNLKTIDRAGAMTEDGTTTYGPIDDLMLEIPGGSNRLMRITDDITTNLKSSGYKGTTSGDYIYDDNGNITHDPSINSTTTYSYLNLPNQIELPDSSGLQRYFYGSDGKLYEKEVRRGPQGADTVQTSRQYIGIYEYVGDTLDQIITSRGYIRLNKSMLDTLSREGDGELQIDIDFSGPTCVVLEPLDIPEILPKPDTIEDSLWVVHYTLKDHLGNSRVVFKDSSGIAVEVSEHHYYPFGLELEGEWKEGNSDDFNYLYNGKELQRELGIGYINYGARYYDPTIGRWHGVDPEAEKYAPWSPYQYTMNSPIIYIDEKGESAVKVVKTAAKMAWKAYKAYRKTGKIDAKTLKKIGLDELVGIAGDLQTVFDSDAGFFDRLGAVTDLVVGTEFNNKGNKVVKKALGMADDAKDAKKGAKNIPKAKRGKGDVSPSQRDPKRAYTKKEKSEMLEEQGGKCAQCRKDKTVDEVDGHHLERHADGGRTTKDNGAAVCKTCHKDIHRKE